MEQTDAAAKLGTVLTPLFATLKQDLSVYITAESQETKLQLTKIEKRLDIIESLLVAKKQPAKGLKTKAEATADAPSADPANTNAAAPTEELPPLPANKKVMFTNDFSKKEDYRKSILDARPELAKELENNEEVKKKKTDEQKFKAMANIAYNWLNQKEKEFIDNLDATYKAMKAKRNAPKEAPGEKESNSPKTEKKAE